MGRRTILDEDEKVYNINIDPSLGPRASDDAKNFLKLTNSPELKLLLSVWFLILFKKR